MHADHLNEVKAQIPPTADCSPDHKFMVDRMKSKRYETFLKWTEFMK